jgi:GT2 family glycosyltransferase
MANMFPQRGKVFQFKDEHPLFSDQFVDIIIPFHGQYEKVTKLVSSLIYYTKIPHFRICIVDDASPNKDYIGYGFEQIPNLLEIRNDQQLGFGASIQRGVESLEKIKRSNQPIFSWIVIMHSDCEVVEPNWLLYLGQSIMKLKNSGIKMVSPLTNNPTIETMKMKASKSLVPENGEQLNDIILTEDDDYLPLYCAMCHRELFRRIGFIKHYPYAGYENKEFAKRMHKYGFYQAVSVRSFIKHKGDCTLQYMRRKRPETRYQISEGNRILYLQDIESN